MLTLVLADNFLLMFVGWEGVGLCSYLLIGFWYDAARGGRRRGRRPSSSTASATSASCSACSCSSRVTGTLQLSTACSRWRRSSSPPAARSITAATLLLFLGATGKSAQIPLYVWLPDAMEGPTPVSALIHAATMVTAGVYMVARTPRAVPAGARLARGRGLVGAATALFAATIGLAQNDIKRVLAYSTVSQLGYMFLACGVGAFTRRHLPPDDARLLQGAAVPRRRLGDPRDVATSRTCAAWAGSPRGCRGPTAPC